MATNACCAIIRKEKLPGNENNMTHCGSYMGKQQSLVVEVRFNVKDNMKTMRSFVAVGSVNTLLEYSQGIITLTQ